MAPKPKLPNPKRQLQLPGLESPEEERGKWARMESERVPFKLLPHEIAAELFSQGDKSSRQILKEDVLKVRNALEALEQMGVDPALAARHALWLKGQVWHKNEPVFKLLEHEAKSWNESRHALVPIHPALIEHPELIRQMESARPNNPHMGEHLKTFFSALQRKIVSNANLRANRGASKMDDLKRARAYEDTRQDLISKADGTEEERRILLRRIKRF